jgi:hypothetical protein
LFFPPTSVKISLRARLKTVAVTIHWGGEAWVRKSSDTNWVPTRDVNLDVWPVV